MKLTSALKRQITGDWHGLFPQLGIYQSLWLARRIGPLVQGVCLERNSGNSAYFPTTHLHNLCRPFPAVSLSLAQRLLNERSGIQERIAVQFHKEHYREGAQRLANASLLPLNGDLTLVQVLDAHHRYREFNRPDSKYPVLLFEDGIFLCAWAGRNGQGIALLNEYLKEMGDWPVNVMARYGGVDKWQTKMRETIANPEALQVKAEAQAHELKVNDLPTAQLLC